MINKKIIVLAIFLVSLLAISAVNAAENATDDVVKDTNDDALNVDETIGNDDNEDSDDEILYSAEDGDDLSSNSDEDALGASPPYYAYSVTVYDTTKYYGSTGSISITVTPSTSNSYTYKYDFYLKIYDSNNNEKISKRYNGGSTRYLTYSLGTTSLSPGTYTIKLVNYADSQVMKTAKLYVISIPASAYSVSVADTTINYASGGSITMTISPGKNYYYTYDFYLKVYDSKNSLKISKRYYSSSSSSKVTYNIAANELSSGTYTIKIVNNGNDQGMATAKLYVKSPLPSSAYYVSISDTAIYSTTSGTINMFVTSSSSSYYYKYDFYLKVFDSNGYSKLSQRYYSTTSSSKLTYNVYPNQFSPGIYTIKIVNALDGNVMSTANLNIKKITLETQDVTGRCDGVVQYKVRYSENDEYKSGVGITFTCNGNEYYKTTDGNGYAYFKIHLKAGTYSVTASSGNAVNYNTIKVNSVYVANRYKDAYVKPLSGFYNGYNKISYGWKGNMEGYFKIYKGSKLVYSTKLNSNGYIKDYFRYNGHNYDYTGSAISKVGTYNAIITNVHGKVLAKAKVKIQRTPTSVKAPSFKTKIGAKKSIRVHVYDKFGSMYGVAGKVKVKINGKTYKAKVRDGYALIKDAILPVKAKTIKCKVKFLGNKNFKASSSKFKIKLSKSGVVILKKNHKIKIGKYTIKLSSKQYKALLKAFKKGKNKSINIKTDYDYKVKIWFYKMAKKYKTTRAVKTWYAGSYMPMIERMVYNGWTKVSEYTYTKANPYNKYGIGLSAYTYAVCKWVKTYPKLTSKIKHYPIKAKIVTKKSGILPKIYVYSHGKTFKSKMLAIK